MAGRRRPGCPECRMPAPRHIGGCPEAGVDWTAGYPGRPMDEDEDE